MQKYTYLIFDADHTLIDFDRDEKEAFRRTFEAFQIPYTAADIELAWRFSYEIWAKQGLNDVHRSEIQATFHQKYIEHLPLLFAAIGEKLPVQDPDALSMRFFEELHTPSFILNDAKTVFADLSKSYKTCIATNGLTKMQNARLKDFLPQTHALFISQDLGTIKPNGDYFSRMLQRLNAVPEDCLFIGDSLSSDVAGCAAAHIPCLWFNPARRPRPDNLPILGEIADLKEVYSYL